MQIIKLKKKLYMKGSNFIKSICCTIILAGFHHMVMAQGQSEQEKKIGKLVVDRKTRFGRLDNGLTYYIRHNELPKERAEFYIVNNVGSMQEEDNQRGLSHFLERMAFNESKHFPTSKGIQSFIERTLNGTKIETYTGFDESVYMLKNVPTIEESIIDSCLMVLHDWSSSLLLEDATIERERKLLCEEWRTSQTSQLRLWEQQLPLMYPQSRYGRRLPTGLLAIIENFRKNELVAYYKKWYRPDLQAIIIVGDVDVNQIEKKIIAQFSDIPKPDHPEAKELFLVPNNRIPIVSIAKDKEINNFNLYIYYKHEPLPMNLKGTFLDLYTNYTNTVIANVMRERFTELTGKPNNPYMALHGYVDDYFVSKSKGAWTSIAIVKPNELENAMNTLISEIEKVKKSGFTEAEFERAKQHILEIYENVYNERDQQDNNMHAEAYIGHFTNNDYIPGIEIEYELVQKITTIIQLDDINNYLKSIFNENENFNNIVISLTGPDKDEIIYPTETELLHMFIAAAKESMVDNEEEIVNQILIPKLPIPGKIVSEVIDPIFEANVYTLGNGAKVVIKQIDNNKDEIQLTGLSPGGKTIFKNENDLWNIKGLNDAILCGGLGDFNAPNLIKALSGKTITFNVGLSDYSEVIKGTTSSTDLKTLFEIVYLHFTAMRKDESAYTAFTERVKASLENISLDPYENFSDSLKSILYSNNARDIRLKPTDFNMINYNRMIDMYNERFADASDFVFTFVGNIEIEKIKPLIEQYLATLPALYRKEQPDEQQVTPIHKGIVTKHFTKKLEAPKSLIHLMYSGEMKYNLNNIIKAQVLNEILESVLYEKIRDKENAASYIFTQVDILEFPFGRSSIQVNFETNHERYNEMIKIVKDEIERIASLGPGKEYLLKSLLTIANKYQELIQDNDYWSGKISSYYFNKLDTHTDYLKILSEISIEDIRKFTKEIIEQGNFIELVMNPE